MCWRMDPLVILVINNICIGVAPEDKNSKNIFAASACVNNNRRVTQTLICNRLTNESGQTRWDTKEDTEWLMTMIPKIAKYFNVDRKDLLAQWIKEYGYGVVFEDE
jgi:hypothetical protein